MREKRNFAKRTKVLASDEVRKKYFLVYEGEKTESIYFEAIAQLRDEINISPLIELVPIVRSYSEQNWSNPYKIVQRIMHNLDESNSNKVSYETLLNATMEFFRDEKYFVNESSLAKNIWDVLLITCQNRLNVKLEEKIDASIENIEKFCHDITVVLEEETELENLVIDVSKIMNNYKLTYCKGFDRICFIVDRDRDSFNSRQFRRVLNICRQHNFYFYVTNPCFEFWLLMHFDDINELDYKKLYKNPKIGDYRYVEIELKKRFRDHKKSDYKKSDYKANDLVKDIDIAISNESKFCEDIEKLKDNLGSNVGLLITQMRN